jgi:hypothetical protein
VSLSVYRNKGTVFGGPLQLQIMELRKRGLRFDAVAKAARKRKDAPCGGRLRSLAGWGPPIRLNASQGGYLTAYIAVNLPA